MVESHPLGAREAARTLGGKGRQAGHRLRRSATGESLQGMVWRAVSQHHSRDNPATPEDVVSYLERDLDLKDRVEVRHSRIEEVLKALRDRGLLVFVRSREGGGYYSPDHLPRTPPEETPEEMAEDDHDKPGILRDFDPLDLDDEDLLQVCTALLDFLDQSEARPTRSRSAGAATGDGD
jgi:hypothetical protein